MFVVQKEGARLHEPPEDIGIVIEGVEVMNELASVASACALLLGVTYALNLAYPKPLRFTFEAHVTIPLNGSYQWDQHNYPSQELQLKMHVFIKAQEKQVMWPIQKTKTYENPNKINAGGPAKKNKKKEATTVQPTWGRWNTVLPSTLT